MRVLIINNRYPSANKPYVASWLKDIYEIVKGKFPDTKLLVDQGNSSGKTGQIKDLLNFYFRLLTSDLLSQQDVLFLHHFNMYWYVIKLRVKNQKLLIHWHGSELRKKSRFSKPEKWNADKVLMNATHIAPSNYFKHLMLKKMPNLSRVEVIPSGGVDVNQFTMEPKRYETNTLVIGFASRLSESKGVRFLIRLATEKKVLTEALGKSIELKAIDYGASEATKTELMSLPVKLVAPMTKKKLPEFYSELDVLIFPSHHESLGLVPLEAMSCGVPVLCPNDFAAPEYCISGLSGELYLAQDYRSFKNNLFTILKNRGNYKPRNIVCDKYSQAYCKLRYEDTLLSIAKR